MPTSQDPMFNGPIAMLGREDQPLLALLRHGGNLMKPEEMGSVVVLLQLAFEDKEQTPRFCFVLQIFQSSKKM